MQWVLAAVRSCSSGSQLGLARSAVARPPRYLRSAAGSGVAAGSRVAAAAGWSGASSSTVVTLDLQVLVQPKGPSSRPPSPLFFKPPHGSWQNAGCEQFSQTMPARTPEDTRCNRSLSSVKTAAPRPYLPLRLGGRRVVLGGGREWSGLQVVRCGGRDNDQAHALRVVQPQGLLLRRSRRKGPGRRPPSRWCCSADLEAVASTVACAQAFGCLAAAAHDSALVGGLANVFEHLLLLRSRDERAQLGLLGERVGGVDAAY